MPACHAKIFQWIPIHNPPIMSNLAIFSVIKFSKVSIDQGILSGDLVVLPFQFLISDLSLEVFHGFFEPALNLVSPLIIMSNYYPFYHLYSIFSVHLACYICKCTGLRYVKTGLVSLRSTVFNKMIIDNFIRVQTKKLKSFKLILEKVDYQIFAF